MIIIHLSPNRTLVHLNQMNLHRVERPSQSEKAQLTFYSNLSEIFPKSVHEPPRSLNPDEVRVAPPVVSL